MTRHHLHGSLGLGSLNFLVRLRFVNRRLIQYPRIIRGSRRFIGTRRFGGVVSRGKRRTRRIKTYQMLLKRWTRDTLERSPAEMKGEPEGDDSIRSCALLRSGVDARPAIDRSRFHFCPPCTPMSSARRIGWASFFLPLWEKTLFVNQHRNHNSLDWFDFLLDKEILFRNRLIRTIFLHRFFLFYSLSVVIITP